jgi:hypothetical protein
MPVPPLLGAMLLQPEDSSTSASIAAQIGVADDVPPIVIQPVGVKLLANEAL